MDVTDISIVVMAVAVTVQTLIVAAAMLAGARAWRKVEARFDAMSARIDEAVVDARIAARAVENLATRADGLMQDATSAAQSIRTAVTVPRALLLTGAASAARWLASKWRPKHVGVLPRQSASNADVF